MIPTLPPFDAVLLLSFGGPEGPDDVLPFLENVTRGRNVPRKRLDAVAEQYLRLGGRSPINDECRKLVAALEGELSRRGPRLPVYWGNRNWPPMLTDTVAEMARGGVRRVVAIATSAYSSYSGCRQYLEDIDRARAAVGDAAPLIEKIPPYWNHAGFLDTMVEHTRAAIDAACSSGAREPNLVFTAHSLPVMMAERCDYARELMEASKLVAEASAPAAPWKLVYQSRSGSPVDPWLEPDIRDHLRELAATGVNSVVVVPIGFVADHMEVVFDLDIQAREVTDSLGMKMTRAKAVGSAPRFVAGLRDLIVAHIEGRSSACAPGCCAKS